MATLEFFDNRVDPLKDLHRMWFYLAECASGGLAFNARVILLRGKGGGFLIGIGVNHSGKSAETFGNSHVDLAAYDKKTLRTSLDLSHMSFPFPAVFPVRLLAALDVTLANYPASSSASGRSRS